MNPDSKVMQALLLAADVVIINVLLIFTALPVVTAGAALAAAHGTLLELINDEHDGVVRTFFRYFRRSWKTATPGWLILLLGGAVLVWEYWALGRMDGGAAVVAQAAVVAGAFLLALWAVWFFPLASRGEAFKPTAKLAAALGIGKLPRSLLALVMLALPAIALLASPGAWAIWLAAMAVLGWALPLYLADLVLREPLATPAEG
ncbi:MAG: DUF624 domain-containing protein [Propionibacteriaceae bacterium]|nr:DUF624 domain-containing protein [Propionibacteriaceae bacterium]